MIYSYFSDAIQEAGKALLQKGQYVKSEKWQGLKENTEFLELLNHYFEVTVILPEKELAKDIKPNLPWADEHFKERISGLPLNPGKSYKIWPFYKKDEKVRTENKKFTHTYMERIWPKFAGNDIKLNTKNPLKGIRYPLGDLNDLIKLLGNEPYTRQAYLPIWFPEDTGVVHGGRVPCTLGYRFIQRNGYLHMTYDIRSCDFFRHFRDDIYLAIKLLYFIIDKLKNNYSSNWLKVKPGIFRMNITSLHIFSQEEKILKSKYK